MSLSASLREQVRFRAKYACEYCGVSEIDVGGMLAVDHFQPRSREGSDDLDNLIYACTNCNQYKQDYWSDQDGVPQLWNPRQDTASQHFVEQEDGQITPLTPVGEFTVKRLRLNRSQLVEARKLRNQRSQTEQLLRRYQELAVLQAQINAQLTNLAIEQQALLQEQKNWLKILLRRGSQ